jgi:hypothetical protein
MSTEQGILTDEEYRILKEADEKIQLKNNECTCKHCSDIRNALLRIDEAKIAISNLIDHIRDVESYLSSILNMLKKAGF